MPSHTPVNRNLNMADGFSLTEILITIALVGVVMSLSLPQLAKNKTNSTKIAVLKDTITALALIQEEGVQAEELKPTVFSTYILSKVNAYRICSTDASSTITAVNPKGPCWNATVQGTGPSGASTQPGFIMSNGAGVIGLDNALDNTGTVWFNQMYIDWNGSRGPNQVGYDQILMEMCFGTDACNAGANAPGTFYPVSTSTASTALYNQVFQ